MTDDGKHRSKVAPVNIAFSSSRNAALLERKLLQYTTKSIKLHHGTLSVIRTQVFKLLGVLACVSIYCADQKQYTNPDFSINRFDSTLQTCVDVAKE